MEVATVHEMQALVRGRRKAVGVSQETLARAAGVSRKWLSEFERGATTAVELPLVFRILGALGLTVDISALVAASDRPAGSTSSTAIDLDDVLSDYSNRRSS